jgi:hypothetical protein
VVELDETAIRRGATFFTGRRLRRRHHPLSAPPGSGDARVAVRARKQHGATVLGVAVPSVARAG